MKHLASHVLGSQRNGVNHVSMNMGGFDAGGPVRDKDYPTYSNTLLDWYKTKNVKSVRLMFTWEAVQSVSGGPVPPADAGYANYWADLTDVIKRLLAPPRDIYVVLAPWQFNSNSGDTDIVYKNVAFTPTQFGDFWGKFAAAINTVTGNDQRVAFDLINEPHTHAESGNKPGDIGISLVDWFKCAKAAIAAIRLAGAKNTIFVPGMAYTAAISFTTNGSSVEWLTINDPNIAVTVHCYSGLGSSSPTVLPDACSAVVAWARAHGRNVHIGEIAIDAGPNGRPTFCGTLATAQAQWDNWNTFCVANSDVLIGWNWWANSAGDTRNSSWWNQGDSCDPAGFHWGLTLKDGATQTVYMNLIESTLPVPALMIRDNLADPGLEPNVTTSVGWESVDIRVTQPPGSVGGVIEGGKPSVVHVLVTNNGKAAYPGAAGHVVRLYWAKAEAGLNWPAPWDETAPGPPPQGGRILPPIALGTIQPGQTEEVAFDWVTPKPEDYPNKDGHFCLLAFVTPANAPEFDGFPGSDLNTNVRNFSNVAWRNIHLVAAGAMKMGNLVVASHTRKVMRAHIGFEILDEKARPIDPAGARLLITATGAALDKLCKHRTDRPFLEDLGHGTFRVLDPAAGIPRLDLRPREAVVFELACVLRTEGKGYAVRAVQSAHDGACRKTIGGQTFVAGEVEGFTNYVTPKQTAG